MPTTVDRELVDALNGVSRAQGRPALTPPRAGLLRRARGGAARPARPPPAVDPEEEAAMQYLREQRQRRDRARA